MSHHTKIREDIDQDGMPISVHICGDCNALFTVCPPYNESWGGCLAETCASYDENRDIDSLFDNDEKNEKWRIDDVF